MIDILGSRPDGYHMLGRAVHVDGQRTTSRQQTMLKARQAGMPWATIADVFGLSVARARDEYADWIDDQQRAHDETGIGMTDDQAATAWLLLED